MGFKISFVMFDASLDSEICKDRFRKRENKEPNDEYFYKQFWKYQFLKSSVIDGKFDKFVDRVIIVSKDGKTEQLVIDNFSKRKIKPVLPQRQ